MMLSQRHLLLDLLGLGGVDDGSVLLLHPAFYRESNGFFQQVQHKIHQRDDGCSFDEGLAFRLGDHPRHGHRVNEVDTNAAVHQLFHVIQSKSHINGIAIHEAEADESGNGQTQQKEHYAKENIDQYITVFSSIL